jgi:carbamoyltransferase
MDILGVSGLYHDSAAALVRDGEIVAAAQEERFSRVKHDPELPRQSIAYCLHAGGVEPGQLDAVVFYEKPLVTLLRIIRTRFRVAPRGMVAFRRALAGWSRQKLWVGYELESILAGLGHPKPPKQWFAEHHVSHAASAFYASPFDSAAVLTFDGVGEFATSSIGLGVGNRLTLERELDFPNSIGLLYSTFTAYCGFRVNSGEYKLMGLAPYGEPRYVDRILDGLLHLHDDGSFTLDQRYFAYLAGNRMYNRRFERLFDGPAREPESEFTDRHADIARSIQEVTELLVLGMAKQAAELTGQRRACLAGGVALNCVSNARLLREGPFDEIWVQPAAGDAGGALGAALHGYHQLAGQPRTTDGVHDLMQGSLLGPAFGDDEVEAWLVERGYPYTRLDPAERDDHVAGLLADGRVVAVVQGRMEFGPRALGNRSILADPRSPKMQRVLNERIKKRESFRPFAPAVKAEDADEWFDLDAPSPYMLLTAPVTASRRVEVEAGVSDVMERVQQVRSEIPAVTHVDHSARVQTVTPEGSPGLWRILDAFDRLTGCPVLVNTSFNVRGEPIVCTPEDAYRCFLQTEIDDLVIGSLHLERTRQALTADAAVLADGLEPEDDPDLDLDDPARAAGAHY